MDRVVPFAVKFVGLQIDMGELLVCDFSPDCRWMRRHQFHECRLGCLWSEAGNSAQPFLQPHITQSQRVRDGVHTVLPGQFDRSLPK